VKEARLDRVVDIECRRQAMGLKLLQQIKEYNRSIPVVRITGQGTKERAVQALRAGAHDFVEKPFQIDELVKRIDKRAVPAEGRACARGERRTPPPTQDKFRFDS